MANKQNGGGKAAQKGVDKKRKHRHAKGKPRIANSHEKRGCSPIGRLKVRLNQEIADRRHNVRPSEATPADLRRWLKTEPTEQELMLKAKYSLE